MMVMVGGGGGGVLSGAAEADFSRAESCQAWCRGALSHYASRKAAISPAAEGGRRTLRAALGPSRAAAAGAEISTSRPCCGGPRLAPAQRQAGKRTAQVLDQSTVMGLRSRDAESCKFGRSYPGSGSWQNVPAPPPHPCLGGTRNGLFWRSLYI